jgi:DNA-binding NarL/FixJ family response regulator
VVAVARTGAELLAALAHRTAELLLLDVGLPDRNGLDLLPEIRRRWPGLKVVAVTMHDDAALCRALMRAGASGFVPKDRGGRELLAALSVVLRGRTYVSRWLDRAGPVDLDVSARYPGLDDLTPRQWEVLRLIGAGRTTLQVAEALGLSHQMVSLHRQNLRRKLGITSEAGLLQCAMLVSLHEPQGPAARPSRS